MSKLFFSAIYLFIAVIVFIYARKAANNEKKLGRFMARVLYLGFGVIISYYLTLISNNYFVMSLGNTGVFFLLDWLLFFLFEFTFSFTGQKSNIEIPKKLLVVFLLADSIALLVNPFHEISITYDRLHINQDIYLIYRPMPPYYIHLALCYIMFLLILIMLFRKAISIPKAYRSKYSLLNLSLIVVVGINAAFLFTGWYIDISIISYGVISCVIYFVSFDYKPTSLLNSTRAIIVEGMNNPVVLFDYEGKFTICNQQAKKVFGFTVEDEGEKTLKTFMEENQINDFIKVPKRSRFETKIQRNGQLLWYHVNFTNLSDNSGRYLGGLFVFTDITEQKQTHFELEYLADHDHLTGAYNRNYFSKIYDTYERMHSLGIVLWNVNSLKLINEFYGNVTGDQVISNVANYIKAGLREEDILIRLEGDELLALLPNIEEKNAVKLMKEIRANILKNENNQLEVSAEFGVAMKETEGTRIEDCLIQARNSMFQKKMMSSSSIRSSIIESLKKSLSQSDYETEEHAERTKKLALRLADKLGLSDREKSELALLSILHDIGKIAIPERILLKPNKLSVEEWDIMKTHVSKGYEIAKVTSELETIAEYILHHHERWDGKGYPSNLQRDEIPLLSRIITVVDSYDVMTNDRNYHKAMSKEEAKNELRKCSGTQFDPDLVEEFLVLLEEEV